MSKDPACIEDKGLVETGRHVLSFVRVFVGLAETPVTSLPSTRASKEHAVTARCGRAGIERCEA